MTSDPVRLGAIGLGRAFALTAPALKAHPGIDLVAAAAPRACSRDAFERAFGGRSYADVPALCGDEAVEAVYVSTPHGLHRDHVLAAAAAGKHVLVEKPIAIEIADGLAMIAACKEAGVCLIIGPSHSFDGPINHAAKLIESGAFGEPRMIHALNATDFLYRPRRPDELDTDKGGGVVFSQAAHQVDMTRRLMRSPASTVTAMTGAWDPTRPTEGAYAAMIGFEGGGFATLTYSGYGRFDSDGLQGHIGELGSAKAGSDYGAARRRLASHRNETSLKASRAFTSLDDAPKAVTHEHFGPLTVFCEGADMSVTPKGVRVFADDRTWFEETPFRFTRAEVCDALYAAVREGKPPLQSGAWGLATLEICHAILKAAVSGLPETLTLQQGDAPWAA